MGLRKAGYISKKRNSNTRKRKSLIVISSEGKNRTEKLYFKGLKSDKISVYFSKGGATDPEGMVTELLRELSEIDFKYQSGDRAYCVFDSDFDESKNEQIAKAEEQAKKKKIDVIVSGPCFEIWYLCHYHYSAKQYSSNDEVIKELQKHVQGYTKSKEGMFELLLPMQAKAIENAKRLEEYGVQNSKKIHTVEFMPSTEVYKIIENANELDSGRTS